MTGRNPFLLIARIGVKENMIEEYLAIAKLKKSGSMAEAKWAQKDTIH